MVRMPTSLIFTLTTYGQNGARSAKQIPQRRRMTYGRATVSMSRRFLYFYPIWIVSSFRSSIPLCIYRSISVILLLFIQTNAYGSVCSTASHRSICQANPVNCPCPSFGNFRMPSCRSGQGDPPTSTLTPPPDPNPNTVITNPSVLLALGRANTGDSQSMVDIGSMYYNGSGVTQNYNVALEWFRKAADAGNESGLYCVGIMYRDGSGIAQDYVRSIRYFQVSAAAGNSDAMSAIGGLYLTGHGVEQDLVIAMRWFRRSAEAGNLDGMNNLGLMYEKGYGVAQNFGRAFEWYNKSAMLGNSGGMYNLGVMYERGYGVAQDYGAATEWYQKASTLNNRLAIEALGRMQGSGLPVSIRTNSTLSLPDAYVQALMDLYRKTVMKVEYETRLRTPVIIGDGENRTVGPQIPLSVYHNYIASEYMPSKMVWIRLLESDYLGCLQIEQQRGLTQYGDYIRNHQ